MSSMRPLRVLSSPWVNFFGSKAKQRMPVSPSSNAARSCFTFGKPASSMSRESIGSTKRTCNCGSLFKPANSPQNRLPPPSRTPTLWRIGGPIPLRQPPDYVGQGHRGTKINREWTRKTENEPQIDADVRRLEWSADHILKPIIAGKSETLLDRMFHWSETWSKPG